MAMAGSKKYGPEWNAKGFVGTPAGKKTYDSRYAASGMHDVNVFFL